MNSTVRKFQALLVAAGLSLGTTSCIKKTLLDGQIESTRKGAQAANTLSDFDVAKRAGAAGLAQFEGMHRLAPYNTDALYLLTKGWAGYGFGFIEDEMEQAEDKYGEDSEMVEYHKQRAIAAYSRAIFYGTKLIEMEHEDLAGHSKNAGTVRAYLAQFDDAERDAPNLLWLGQAWLSRVNMLKDDQDIVGELFIGVAMLERSVELDPDYNYATGHGILGAYHARTAMAELEDSKKHFDIAVQKTEGKALLVKLNFALKYYCTKANKEKYVGLLTEIVEAGDVLPEQRIQNTIAKRRARRNLSAARMDRCAFPE